MFRQRSKALQNNYLYQSHTNTVVVNEADQLFELSIALLKQGSVQQARETLEKVIKLNPKHFDAYHLLGTIAGQTSDWTKALDYFKRAIEINDSIAAIHNNYGIVLKNLGFLEEALNSYSQAILLMHNFVAAYYNRGIVLNQLKRYDAAIESFNKAINLKPDYSEAYNNCGLALKEINKFQDAINYYTKAIEIDSNNVEAFCNFGAALSEFKYFEEALVIYEKAINLNPDYFQAFFNRGNTLVQLKRFDQALASYQKANNFNPELDFLFGSLLYVKMNMCDWSNFQESIEVIFSKIEGYKKIIEPFPLLALVDELSIQQRAVVFVINDKYPALKKQVQVSTKSRHKKIRIGYISADFREHPVSYLMVDLFELHDKSKFELIGFYSGPQDMSLMHQRVSSAFDTFINICQMSDMEVVKLFKKMEIDIGVDLNGATNGERIGIFAHRAAPVQISYLGFLGTLGAEYYDYLIADKTIIPKDSQKYYTEKIIYLPSYQANDSKRIIADKTFTRAELNLPDNGFVFCCFNNNYKITPATFDGWMRILNSVPGSVLFLYSSNPWAQANLKKEAEKRGVSNNRLVFGGLLERSEYLARFRTADLFLDTLPYNAGTTASDALWAGLPVLTCMGESFAGRVAASLLQAIELPELITANQKQYEAKAIELAMHPEKLKIIKAKLEKNRLTTALFDTPRFAKNIETAFTQIYERYQADLEPENIYILD